MLNFSSLEHVFQGFSASRFRTEHFEQRPLFLAGALSGGPYHALFGSATVENLLAFGNMHFSEIEVIKDGSVRPVPELYTMRGNIKVGVIHRLFEAGHHFRLLGIQRRDRMMSKLSLVLSKSFSSSVPVNAYISPANSQGFHPHYDCHDVLAVQTVGRKHWSIYTSDQGTPVLPLPEQEFVRERDEHRHGDLVAQYTLTEGDVLYIPRGIFHSASTTSSASVHLTFAIRPPTWASVLGAALNELCQSETEFRKFPIPDGSCELTDAQIEHAICALSRHMDKKGLASLLARFGKSDFVIPERALPWFDAEEISSPTG